LKNTEGEFQDSAFEIPGSNGWWNSLVAGDFDNDGDIDYLAGNLGLNTKLKASPEEPLCIYANDYDKNGRIDPVMCYYLDGENYIAHSRDDIIDQINAMRVRFRTYTDYAESTFEKSFLKSELKDALVVKAEEFQSSYIENLGNGNFQLRPLPIEAQIAPVFGMTVNDIDDDGNLDALLVGNFYPNEVTTGRYDASIGLLLKGEGGGNLVPVRVNESGFFADKDARGMATLSMEEKDLFLVANNSDSLMLFQSKQKQGELFKPQMNDVFAKVNYSDGSVQKQEFYYGATYLSQSSRSMRITENMTSVEVTNTSGETRKIK